MMVESLAAFFKVITLVTEFTSTFKGPGRLGGVEIPIFPRKHLWQWLGVTCFSPCILVVVLLLADRRWEKSSSKQQTSGLPHDSLPFKEYVLLPTSEGSRYSLPHTKHWNLCFLFLFIFILSTIGFVLFCFFPFCLIPNLIIKPIT